MVASNPLFFNVYGKGAKVEEEPKDPKISFADMETKVAAVCAVDTITTKKKCEDKKFL